MGNANAVIQDYPWDWVEFQGDLGAYDSAGYRPTGLTYAPQQSWSEAENYGGDKHMVTHSNFKQGGTNKWSVGVTEGIMTSFGTLGYRDADYLTDLGYVENLVQKFGPVDYYYDGAYANIQRQPVAYDTWKPDNHKPADPTNPKTWQTCTPLTFPFCTMEPMLLAGGSANFYDGKTMDSAFIYTDSINRAYTKGFVNGGIEALNEVNQTEHSTYDPCDQPSLFEVLFPLIVATGMTGAFEYYGKPELTVFAGQGAASTASICVFGFGYNLSKGMVEYFHEADNHYYRNAARFLLLPFAAYAGSMLGVQAYTAAQSTASQNTYMVIGAGVGIVLGDRATPHLARALTTSTFLAALILGTFGLFTRAITHFFCSLTANFDSCADYDKDPTNRRWDAVSIASMLTLEVCDREGWAKDDARAEFVFRGLLYGPALMNLPVADNGLSAFDETILNPLGYIYSGRWKQAFPGKPPTNYQRSNNVIGWDGGVSGVLDVANSNLYACENWDLLRQGAQTNSHPGALRVAKNIDAWIGTWDNPRNDPGILVQAANIPSNLQAMLRIPGLDISDATNTYKAILKGPFKGLHDLPPDEHNDLTELPFFETAYSESTPLQELPPSGTFEDLYMRLSGGPVIGKFTPNQCAAAWQDIMDGTGAWRNASASQVHDYMTELRAQPYCSQCPIEDIGKIYVLDVALGGSQGITCAEFVAILQRFGWGAYPEVINHAVEVVASTQSSAITNLALWADGFLQSCNHQGLPSKGFATLPASITNTWCT